MARQATKPKVTKAKPSAPRRNSNASRIMEEKHIGQETVDWANVKNFNDAVQETLRHYGYFYDHKETIKWAADWMKSAGYTKTQIANFRAAEPWRTSTTVCSLCKMSTNGAQFDDTRIAWMKSHIDKTVEYGKEKKSNASEGSVVTASRKSPTEIIKDRTSDFIAEIEGVIDNWGSNINIGSEEYSVYSELQKNEAAYNTAKSVFDYYTPLKEELQELTGPKKKGDDAYDQLVEGYSNLTKKKQKEYLAFISTIVSDAEKYMASKKAVRKTRKKKPVSISQQISKVKYLKESAEFKIASISPQEIVGASIVFLMHTKTRTVTRIESSSTSGMGIRGTTIINFDEDKCDKKKLRKPEEFLSAIAKTTKIKMNREYAALTTKPSPSNGRINTETIILKVFK